jgi:hypothetical protein
MPVHDWTRVTAGIFHDFHHERISTIKRALNAGLLPAGSYALAQGSSAAQSASGVVGKTMRCLQRGHMPRWPAWLCR